MISQETGDEVHPAHLLEIGELRDLEPVEQHLPPDAPGAEGRRLPVVLLEADVVQPRVDAAGLEAIEVGLLDVVGRRLEDHLHLVVLEQPVRVLPESAVVGAPRRLDVGDAPGRRSEHAEQRFRMRGAGPHLEVKPLLNQAALGRPERRQLEDQVLERHTEGPPSARRHPAQFVNHSNRPRLAIEMRANQRPVHLLQLPQGSGVAASAATAAGPPGGHPPRTAPRPRTATGPRGTRPAASAASTRNTAPAAPPAPPAQRLERGRAEPEQPLVRVGLGRPLVDELGEVVAVAERSRGPPPPSARAMGSA